MDLGAVGLDGLGSDLASDHEPKHKWYGSGFLLKQQRSENNNSTTAEGEGDEDEYWRSNKVAKTDEKQRNSLLRSSNNNAGTTLFSDGGQQQQMLSFSSPKSSETNFLVDKSSPNAAFAYPYLPLSSCNRNNTGSYSSGSMHGIIAGTRGPFTPSQWMELEHQALIYKYITANVPVPSHLLIPIKKALVSAGFCNFSAAFLRPNAMGWGGFHLGFSNNTDPEPGRCRRTDGKKWRCSRDAVVDQKYCERHMNRGRHRSRKPVEGQSGHALTGTTNTTTTTNANNNAATASATSKLMMMPNNNSVVAPGGTASNSLTFAQQQQGQPNKNMHTLASDTSATNTINRMFMSSKENGRERIPESDSLPMLPPTLELKPKEDNNNNHFMIHKHQQFPYEESSRNEFGFVTSDSLLNPSQKNSSTLVSSRGCFGSPQNRESVKSQHSLRHFIDDWPKHDMQQSERTELSISIPMTTSTDFMSSTSSPNNDKVNLSPLRLSREFDPIQMGLGVGNNLSGSRQQGNWIPIRWESSMGGPLGEVLNVSNNNNSNAAAGDHRNQCASSSGLNLMTDGWDNSPPLGGSSPTGVLQKTAFGSLSNSSAGSSPRAENHNNKTQEGASFCNDLLSSTLGNSSL